MGAQESTLSLARLLTLATLAATCASVLAVVMGAGPIDRATRDGTGLASFRLSREQVGDAIVLAGFTALVCAQRDCAR